MSGQDEERTPADAGLKPVGTSGPHEYRFFLIAGEHSGDALGAKLIEALRVRLRGRLRVLGVGGDAMERQGLSSQFPLHEVAVMGPLSILPRLPRIMRRVYGTVAAAIAAEPDVVVIIDSPEFTHAIAKRIRRRRPDIPIVDYVSPSVWAWRPGRAKKMRRYVDHVLALLPFEPEAHERLGGPACTYVGHPLIERRAWLDTLDPAPLTAELGLDPAKPRLLVLPGSRRSEVGRLIVPFGEAVRQVMARTGPLEVIIPAVPWVRPLVEEAVKSWPIVPHLVEGEDNKFRAFKLAHAALAASGTVTLELALLGTPSVIAYRVDPVAAPFLRRMIKAPTVVLANLVAGHNVYPEFHQEDCSADKLAAALLPLLSDSPERRAQLASLAGIPDRLETPSHNPSEAAAQIVISYAEKGRDRSRP